MARFFVVGIIFATLVCSGLALPQTISKNVIGREEEISESPSLVVLTSDSTSGDLKFFFPFNFWNNIFRPLPWIPLPGLIQTTTTAKPQNAGSDDKGKDDKDKDDKDKNDGNDKDKEGTDDTAGNDKDEEGTDENAGNGDADEPAE